MIAAAIAEGLVPSTPEILEENDALLPFKIIFEVLWLYLFDGVQPGYFGLA
ncbi:hypothetical protein PGR6_19300 [Pseudomonas sp. GR 6-02]|nr:hypothetical protein PGR6_19300 [Pseudomonas sp. GR 6-02]